MLFDIAKLILAVIIAIIAGKLISGMFMGPYAIKLINNNMLNSLWFTDINHVCEITIGLMIGTELVWKQIKKSGKQIIIMTLTESVGTFIVVTAAFSICFWILKLPVYIAPIMGSISLATAPAPSLSIVKEYNADGPVTRTLILYCALLSTQK